MVQLELQPSPLIVLLSSHYYLVNMMTPSPHIGEHLDVLNVFMHE